MYVWFYAQGRKGVLKGCDCDLDLDLDTIWILSRFIFSLLIGDE